jgi:hypothetical protein
LAQQGEPVTGGNPFRRFKEPKLSEFDEVITAAGSAELQGRTGAQVLLLQPALGRRHPRVVEQGVIKGLRPESPAEVRPLEDRFAEPDAQTLEIARRLPEDGEVHAAADVHADGVRDDGVLHGGDAADGHAITDVCVGHERAGDDRREAHDVFHLLPGGLMDGFGPVDAVAEWRGARRQQALALTRGQYLGT